MNLWQRALEAVRRPGRALALSQTQTDVSPMAHGERAMVGWLHREFSEHPSKGLTPATLYQILIDAERGNLRRQHELFADMEEKDAQIASDLGKRKLALCKLEWQIVPPEGASRIEKKAAAQAGEVFAALEVEDLVVDLADGIGHGWACLEIPWALDGQTRRIQQPIHRPHGWFMTNPDVDQNELRLRDGSITGEELWPLGWVRHVHKSKSGNLARLGLHRVLVWPYLFRNYAVGDLAELLDILGIPARLGKYPHGSTEEEKTTLLNAVMSLGRKAAGIIPDGMIIEYLEAAKATGEPYQIMLDWCERAVSKAILGGTLTTGTDSGGAYALGEVHERGLRAIVGADARQIAGSINRDILLPMAALNFGIVDQARAPRFYLDTGETEDYELLAKSIPVFVDMGARIPRWWLHEKTGIPEAQAGEEILARAQPTPSLTPAHGADDKPADTNSEAGGDAELTTRLAARSDPDWPERNALDLERLANPLVSAMLEPVWSEMRRAKSMPELQARLLELYPEIDGTDLSELMGRAFVAAHLAGRNEAEQGARRG